MSGSRKSTALAGIVISAIVIAAVASVGFYQLFVAPQVFTTQTTSTASALSSLVPGTYINITIPNAASSPPPGYTEGAKTQYGYSPDTVTVVIGKNSTIFWNNDDVAPHTATSDPGDPTAFDTSTIPPGASAEVTFTTPGTYTYHCSFHSWMQGTIIVKSG